MAAPRAARSRSSRARPEPPCRRLRPPETAGPGQFRRRLTRPCASSRAVRCPESAGTSPKALRITASSNSPRFGSPLREKATAPALALSKTNAWARRMAAAPLGHSTASPGRRRKTTGAACAMPGANVFACHCPWLGFAEHRGGPRTPENPTVETDSVAGHIGFELRCAERIFISLRNRIGSDLRKPVQTVATSQENNLLCGG
jgi:hypothetical protein